MKTKLHCLIWLTLSILTLCTLCLAEAPALTPPTFEWERNAAEHWRLQPDSARTDAAPHALVDQRCTVCGCELWLFEDGAADVSDYDVHGNLVRYSAFDADGSVILDLRYAHEYDAEGHLLTSWEFDGDLLSSETIYTLGENDERIPVMQRFYQDGSLHALNEYDAFGNAIHNATYAPDGSVIFEEYSEYALLPDGSYYEAKRTTFPAGDAADPYGIVALEVLFAEDGMILQESESYADGMKLTTEYNPNADPVRITTYDAAGTVIMVQSYEYEYAEDMTFRRIRAYVDGSLVIETEFARGADGQAYPAKETVYSEDGSSVTFTFAEDGSILTETTAEAAQ